MEQPSQDSHDWYDDDVTVPLTSGSMPTAGLPDSWQHYSWWLASLAFSAFWMAESWADVGPEPGMTGLGPMIESLWALLITLTLCYGLYQFFKPRVGRLSNVICIAVAAVALLGRGF